MKKLFFFGAALLASFSVSAKDCAWNFTTIFTEAKTFATGDGTTAEAIVDNELYTYGCQDKGFSADVAQSPKYFVNFFTEADQNTDKKVARLKSQGTGSIAEGAIYGALAFKVGGPSLIQVAAISSSGSAVRKMEVYAGMTKIGEITFDGNIGKKVDGAIVTPAHTFEYNGNTAATIYIISAKNTGEGTADADGYTAGGINYYKVAATNVIDWNSNTAVENVAAQAQKAVKVIENGQLYIIKNGVKYNALGVQVAE